MKNAINIIVLSLSCLLTIKAQTPNFQWAKQLGGTNFDRPECISSDGAGNVYTAGNFFGISDFDPGAGVYTLTCSSTANDGFVSKLDPNGNFVWAKQLRTIGNSQASIFAITIDASGNIITTGQFSGSVDFDPGVGTFSITSIMMDIFVWKIDANGNFIWAKQFGGSTVSSTAIEGEGIVTDNTGNVYTTGRYNQTVDFDPGPGTYTLMANGFSNIFISKLDASGNFIWAKSIGGTIGDMARAIDIDASNNIYTTGFFNGTVDFDPNIGTYTVVSSGSSQDAYVNKLDANGNFVWVKTFDGPTGSDVGTSIVVDPTGFVYTSGDYRNTVDFDPGSSIFNVTSVGFRDVFITKLDLNGQFVWAKSIGSTSDDNCYDISKDPSGNIFTTGQFQGTMDFDPGVGTYTISSLGSTDIFLSGLTSSGNIYIAAAFGGTGGERGEGVAANSTNIYLTGFFTTSTDFNPGPGTFTLAASGSNDDVAVVKLSNCSGVPNQPSSIAGLNNLCIGSGVTNYSVASVSGASSYSWSLPSGWSGSSTTNTISATTGTASGNISVTASNACGTSSASVLNVTVNPLPTITASSSSSIICGPPGQQTATLTVSGASTYTWNPGGIGASIAVSPSVTSTYTVTGTSANGCNSTTVLTQSVSACTNVIQLTESSSGLQVYPNPFSSIVNIQLNSEVLPCEMKVYNVIGELVYKEMIEKEKVEVDLHQLSPGIYFIKTTIINKIIKN